MGDIVVLNSDLFQLKHVWHSFDLSEWDFQILKEEIEATFFLIFFFFGLYTNCLCQNNAARPGFQHVLYDSSPTGSFTFNRLRGGQKIPIELPESIFFILFLDTFHRWILNIIQDGF